MRSFAHARRARFVECDPQSRVNNCHYLAWIDDATVEWLRSCGNLYRTLHECGYAYVVAQATLHYLDAVRFDDRVSVLVQPLALGATSLTVGFTVRCAARPGGDCAKAELRYVCIDALTERPAPWPAHVADALAPWCGPR